MELSLEYSIEIGMMKLVKKSSIVIRLAVPFFGGFLGAIGVACMRFLLGVIGFTPFLAISLQWLQDFSWGGAMWGFIPAVFLLARKGNVYLVSLLTMIIAVTYGLFILQGLPFMVSSKVISAYIINLLYSAILAVTIKASRIKK